MQANIWTIIPGKTTGFLAFSQVAATAMGRMRCVTCQDVGNLSPRAYGLLEEALRMSGPIHRLSGCPPSDRVN